MLGRDRGTDVDNRLMNTGGEREGRMNGESNCDICTLSHMKQMASGKLPYRTGSSVQCPVVT